MTAPPWENHPASGPLLRLTAAAKYLSISRPHYYKLANEGQLPKLISLSPMVKAVPKTWLDAVIAARAGEVS